MLATKVPLCQLAFLVFYFALSNLQTCAGCESDIHFAADTLGANRSNALFVKDTCFALSNTQIKRRLTLYPATVVDVEFHKKFDKGSTNGGTTPASRQKFGGNELQSPVAARWSRFSVSYPGWGSEWNESCVRYAHKHPLWLRRCLNSLR